MRLASFNLENLFDRAKALNLETWAAGKVVLEKQTRLNRLLQKPRYSAADKQKILTVLKDLELDPDDEGDFVVLRQNRGRLVKRSKRKLVEVVASGRGDWIGWLELRTEHVDETATRNTAQVIRDVGADVLGVVEVESRSAVLRFNEQLLPEVGAQPYAQAMVIDGNDERGIDIGLLSRSGFEILSMRSHVDDRNEGGGRVFSRDCAEYEIAVPSGEPLLLLVNHLKSKGFGTVADSNARRAAQARRVREIYDERRAAGVRRVAVIGDLNDTPEAAPLSALLAQGSDLRDVSLHPKFQDDGRPGTFGNGTKSQKLDYILLSPELFQRVELAGVFRKGVWGGKNGTLWPIYPEMKKAVDAASDHAAIWVELSL